MASSAKSILAMLVGLILGLLFGAGAAVVYIRGTEPPPPTLKGVTPAQAKPGDTVTLKGTGFDPHPEGNTVLFGSRTGKVVFVGPSELRVEVPEGTEATVEVRVLVGHNVFGPVELSVGPAVTVAAVVEPEAVASPSPAPPPDTAPPRPAPGKAPPPTVAGRPPTPPPVARQVTGLLQQAENARDARQYEAAARLYEQALSLDPKNPDALSGRADALAGTSLGKSFVADATDVGSVKGVPEALPGFDSGGVAVKRAPEVFGWIDFEVSPQRVRPGDPYTVKIYLVNNGKKAIKIKDLSVATLVNGARVGSERSPRAKEIPPRERALIESIPEIWRDGVKSWAMEVRVTSARGDTYHNMVSWR